MPPSPPPKILVSRHFAPSSERETFEEALIARLIRSGAQVIVVPHLYYLSKASPTAQKICRIKDSVSLASWLEPRAAFWTMKALGFAGGKRTLRCLNIAAFKTAADCAKKLLEHSGPLDTKPSSRVIRKIDEIPRQRWYPVIDYSRCVACRKCCDFCLFGVYSIQGARVVVTAPDNCKNGCPACARTCPRGAIIFPHYFAEPLIAGAEKTEKRIIPAKAKKTRDLDGLINALERLDE